MEVQDKRGGGGRGLCFAQGPHGDGVLHSDHFTLICTHNLWEYHGKKYHLCFFFSNCIFMRLFLMYLIALNYCKWLVFFVEGYYWKTETCIIIGLFISYFS